MEAVHLEVDVASTLSTVKIVTLELAVRSMAHLFD